jgi:hypothetical protein
MDEIKLFFRGVNAMPLGWRAWLGLLVALNFAVPLAFIARPEAQATLAAMAASMVFMLWLIRLRGYTRLIGLGHIFWVPLIVLLWTRFDEAPALDVFGLWMRAVVAVNVLSLVIDAVDVTRYVRGERASLVPSSRRD